MSNKRFSGIAGINAILATCLISSFIDLIIRVDRILIMIKNYGIIKNINCSITSITIIINNDIYSIKNTPLGLAFISLLFNFFVIIKIKYSEKLDKDLQNK